MYDEPNGYFADAGVVIGEALPSPCQPNFIHVAVRKLNSTVEVCFLDYMNIDSVLEWGIIYLTFNLL